MEVSPCWKALMLFFRVCSGVLKSKALKSISLKDSPIRSTTFLTLLELATITICFSWMRYNWIKAFTLVSFASLSSITSRWCSTACRLAISCGSIQVLPFPSSSLPSPCSSSDSFLLCCSIVGFSLPAFSFQCAILRSKMSRMRQRIRSDKLVVSMDSCSSCVKTSSITSLSSSLQVLLSDRDDPMLARIAQRTSSCTSRCSMSFSRAAAAPSST
mmetsp:Transcript_28625/g.74910  ORF Transcript_28625/g.74910 Transcript_28625/m.74910 type:complete len:215 (-) Transcript_28625:723-1367(-)